MAKGAAAPPTVQNENKITVVVTQEEQPSSHPPVDRPRVVDLPLQCREADVVPRTINEEDRSFEAIFTTTAGVRRVDYWTGKPYIEVLSMDPAAVRLTRLNAGASLLNSHSAWSVDDILGATVPGSAELRRTSLIGRVRISRRPAVDGLWQDVRDGIVRQVSIGYRIYRFIETPGKTEDAPPTRTAVDWEPYEVSLVPIAADAAARVRQSGADGTPCEIVVRAATAVAVEDPPQTQTPAAPANKETSMKANEPSETIIEHEPAATKPAPAPTEPTEGERAAKIERERCKGITDACRAARLPQSFADKLRDDGVDLSTARAMVLAELEKRADPYPGAPPQTPAGSTIVGGDDPIVHKRRGIEKALLHRVAPDITTTKDGKTVLAFPLDDEAREYRGLSLMDMAEIFLRSRGIRVTGMSKSERALAALSMRDGMHATADFPLLLADVANKVLRAAYEAAPQTWLPLAKQISLSDFKASKQLQVGDAPGLLEVLEHGEFTSGTITEAREQVSLKTYGRIFAITRQALINDDTNAFADVPASFGRAARTLESDLAWAQITSNPLMGDGVALFIAAHGNLSPFGQTLTLGHLGDGRTAMRLQKGIDGVTPLNLTPQYLIVPAALETTGDQLVTAITPAIATLVANPFGPNGRTPLTLIVESRLDANSDKAWYMACPASQAPVLFYATLDGQAGPQVEQQLGFDIDGLKIKCRLDVGFKAADWRAIYKDTGA